METVVIHGLAADGGIVECDASSQRFPWKWEREGRWTVAEFNEKEEIVIFREANWKLKQLVSIGLFVVLAFVLLGLRSIEAFCGTAVIFIPFLISRTVQIMRYTPLCLVIAAHPLADESTHGDIISSGDIDSILIRKNRGREGDDTELIQVLIHLQPDDSWELVYQSYYWSPKKAISVAEQLATWLNSKRSSAQ